MTPGSKLGRLGEDSKNTLELIELLAYALEQSRKGVANSNAAPDGNRVVRWPRGELPRRWPASLLYLCNISGEGTIVKADAKLILDAITEEIKKFQGTWKQIAIEKDGVADSVDEFG